MSEPLVSCILVTGGDCHAASLAIRGFERQEYEPRELIILDDGQAALATLVPAHPRIRHFQLGPEVNAAAMRDFGCREARGDVIAHWSDRAWYGPHYLLCLLNALLRDGADVCGLNPALFCDTAAGRAWRFTSGGARQVFASGSVCYRRDFWQAHPLVSAEDPDGLVLPPHGRITALSGPACQVSFAPPPAAGGAGRLKSCALAGVRRVLGRDWHSYAGSEEGAAPPVADLVIDRQPQAKPLVSCLMLARDPRFVSAAVNWFLLQNYEPKELLVVEAGAQAEHLAGQDARLRYIRPGPGVSAGAARNLACEQARGELIVHWDDCDWQAPIRLPRTVQALLGGDADVCVSNPALCYGLEAGQASLFDCPPEARYWAAPGSLSYRRAFWAANRFPDTDLREDLRFVWNAPAARVVSLPESSCRVSMRADRFEGAYWHPHPVEDVRRLLGEDWNFLETEVVAPEPPAGAEAVAPPPPLVSCIMTACGDPRSAALAVEYFLRQDYAPSELIVVDDGAEPLAESLPEDRRIRYFRIASPMPTAAKRSLACQHARGEFILRWESGWWYAADRIRRMVEPLVAAQAGIGGLHAVLLYDVTSGVASQWRSDGRPHASSLCHRRSLSPAQFPELVAGEGLVAIPHSPDARFLPLADPTCQVLIQRDRGRVPAFLEGAYREPYPAPEVRSMMGDDWQFYEAEIEAPEAPIVKAAPSRARAVEPAARARKRALPAQPARSAAGDPRVSCIMPTYNRRRFVPLAIEYFLRQDYEPRELIVVDDGSDPVEDMVPADGRFRYIRVPGRLTVGAKRNLACAEARGEIILHWDDDEWYAPRRIRAQVRHLLREGADLCGLNPTLFYDLGTSLAWLYRYPAEERFWVSGTSFCYRREFWERKPFAEVDVGEDNQFLWEAPPARMSTLPDSACVVAMIHDGNVSSKSPGGGYWEPFDAAEMRRILGEDFAVYERAAAIAAAAPRPPPEPSRPVESRAEAGGERPRLSILICSLFDRASYLSALTDSLARQARKDVEVLVEIDDGRKTIGAKRNSLLGRATGDYVCFIDDDDTVSSDYLEQIFKGIDRDVDHVGLRQITTTNGQNPRECRSSAHYSWEERDGITWRGILHLNPLKREIAQQVRYPEISFGEDFQWGTAVAQLGAIRTEYLVEKPIYFYDYREPKGAPVRPLKLLLKFPSRNRPQALGECLDSVLANLHDRSTRMVVSLDEDDPQAATYRAMLNAYSLTVRWGRSRNKIHAVNRDIPDDDWDILVVISDDMRVVAPAFDLQIAADMRESFSGTDGFLHYNDGFVGERLATIPVLGREYYERFGFVYHPDYRALWCDNEQMEAAQLLEKYRYIPRVLIEHRHAGNVGAALDTLYLANERFFEQDKSTFLARKAHSFFLFP
jgi:glycosyltransferase involved in cell wall biosynthesis